MDNTKYLWCVLVPCNYNDGTPVTTKHHKEWDRQVQKIAGGLTISNPIRGKWVSPCGRVFEDRMIPVLLKCTSKELVEIVERTAKHYHQEAIFHYKVTNEVVISYFGDKYTK